MTTTILHDYIEEQVTKAQHSMLVVSQSVRFAASMVSI